MSMTAKQVADNVDHHKNDRTNWDNWFQDLTKYCIPRKATITEQKSSGTKFDTDIYDSTARESSKIAAAGLMGHMTNPASDWFELRTQDEDIMEAEGVKDYLAKAQDKIHSVLNASNFYQQIHEFYLELFVLGTSGFFSEEDDEDLVRFYSRPIKGIYFDEDAKGRIETVYWVFELTAQQAFVEWKNQSGASVLKAISKKEYRKKFEFCLCVSPRGLFDRSKKDRLNMPMQAIWVNLTDKKRMKEGGFQEQPFNVARFSKESGEKMGYSAAMDVLPDIKMANKIMWVIIRASMKATDPPIVAPDDQYILPFNFNASGVNYRAQASGTGAQQEIQILDHKGNIVAGRELLEDVRNTIKAGFFTDLFLMLAERKNMTAFEVAERVQEKMLILGPVLGRLQTELLSPVINRVFQILIRNDELGTTPTALVNAQFKVEYISVLAKAQKFSEIRTLQTFLEFALKIGEVFPEVQDKIEADETIDRIADILGIHPKVLTDATRLQVKRKARAETAAMNQQIQLAAAGVEIGAKGAQAAGALAKTETGGEE